MLHIYQLNKQGELKGWHIPIWYANKTTADQFVIYEKELYLYQYTMNFENEKRHVYCWIGSCLIADNELSLELTMPKAQVTLTGKLNGETPIENK